MRAFLLPPGPPCAFPVSAALLLLALASCSKPPSPSPSASAPAGKPTVHATNYPVTYFAQRIAADHAEIRFAAPPDGDPAFWQPSIQDVSALQSANAILLNGATYEKWLDKVNLPRRILVDTSSAFASALIESQDTPTHSHGKEGAHSHGGTAFTTWIDFQQAQQQAEAVRAALVRLVPSAAADMDRNAASLAADLDKLDADLLAVAQTIGARPLLASHPVYQYFARRYQLRVRSVSWEPEIVPDEVALQELQQIRSAHPAQWMIWEGEPAAAAVAKLEVLGVKSVVFNPCGNRPASGDWLAIMRRNVDNLRAVR